MIQGPRADEIQNIFSSVADKYDQANDAMTFGMAHFWRRTLVKWSDVKASDHVLDCATGTGDLAFAFKKRVGPTGQVIGTDFCQAMLSKAPPKAKIKNLAVDFQLADAMNLPFESNRFDVVSIAYGIRNVADPLKALTEMARVCKPGGRVMILETGDSPESGLRLFFEFYLRQVIPRVGGLITGQRFAYEYLNKSSLNFPSRERFIELMNSTEVFAQADYKVLFGGASFVYRGLVK